MIERDTEAMRKAYQDAKDYTARQLEVGNKFVGAWGVCEALGYTDRKSWEWIAAEHGALWVLNGFDIYTDETGTITRLDPK